MACESCGRVGKLHVHHKDGNHANDVAENRMFLCPKCHRKAHVEMNIALTGRPSKQPLSERTPDPFPSLGLGELKKQYAEHFPRV